jgi:hypothetical protein
MNFQRTQKCKYREKYKCGNIGWDEFQKTLPTEGSSAWPDMSSLKLADILLHSLKNTSTGALLPVNTFLREVHLKRTKLKKIQFIRHQKTVALLKRQIS